MTRARCVLGDSALHARFEGVRKAVISSERDHAALRDEIGGMRAKVRAGHAVRGEQFDVKHSPGGMVDVEFAVQFLVLAQAANHPGLVQNFSGMHRHAQRLGIAGIGLGPHQHQVIGTHIAHHPGHRA